MKRRSQMPGYYGKNIAQHAQKRFFQRKAQEADKKHQERDDLHDNRGEREHL